MNLHYLLKLIIEAFFVGILTVLVGSLITFCLSSNYLIPKISKDCKNYNKYFIREITLFLTGFCIHIFCEMVGLNTWYIKNSAAQLINLNK